MKTTFLKTYTHPFRVTSVVLSFHKNSWRPSRNEFIERTNVTELNIFYNILMQSGKNTNYTKNPHWLRWPVQIGCHSSQNKSLTKLYSEEVARLYFEDLLVNCKAFTVANNIIQNRTIPYISFHDLQQILHFIIQLYKHDKFVFYITNVQIYIYIYIYI